MCEGERTEPDYFNHLRRYFRLTTVEVEIVKGAGNTLQLVKKACSLAKKDEYDHVWVVFDKDDFPSDHFDQAVDEARSSGFEVAYSNQSFEYWLLLHFEDHQGGKMPRSDYSPKLNDYFRLYGLSFDSKGLSRKLFELLVVPLDSKKSRMDLAIQRAERILERHENKKPSEAESSTTVFQLVTHLLASAPFCENKTL
ncbi:MAG: RloB family protein [Saprospiraceae bacterium]|nr:RloB family protein [Saprospiraceae bacterium]